ncbi:Reticulon-domain-containing protein [Gongronella butleri]|nr:Reticulon-domain-containing protein [Gongronella butleri]
MTKAELLELLLWEWPARSGGVFAGLLTILYVNVRYSWLAVLSSILTLAIGVNLIYVTFAQRVPWATSVSSGSDDASPHPYQRLLDAMRDNTASDAKSKHQRAISTFVSAFHHVSVELKSIVLIESNEKSLICFFLFYVTWRLAALLSTHTLLLVALISAFTLPKLYYTNQELIETKRNHVRQCLDRQWSNLKAKSTATTDQVRQRSRRL